MQIVDSVLFPLFVILIYIGAIYTLAWIIYYLFSRFRHNFDHLFRSKILLQLLPRYRRNEIKARIDNALDPRLRQPEFWIEYAKTALLVVIVAMLLLGLALSALGSA